jgi:hypothetical protein
MDIVSTSALAGVVSQVLGGAAGEAGKQAWDNLVTLVRRLLPGTSAETALATTAPGDGAAATRTSQALVDAATADPAFAAALDGWYRQAVTLVGGNVTNIISGDARISGNVMQARDIHGPITFN